MAKHEAPRPDLANVIRAVADSLEQHPEQFRIEVKATATGLHMSDSARLTAAPQGGGPGSTTVGVSISGMQAAQVSELQFAVGGQVTAEMQRTIDGLRDLAVLVEQDEPDVGRLARLWGGLKTGLPPVVTAALGTMLGDYGSGFLPA